ncbi:unnamed protein product [Ambrosiozyma monospora]|uniref:Unnamed protein product n=1 Tax=Ambrosiozyma monospora TaxID=43982 RepID=A0A9W6T6H4_AMBMO|nr:unnamed protein product [Ambrosiozyma monospora]
MSSNNILLDKLLSNCNLSQLNDYSLTLLSSLESNNSNQATVIKDQFTKLFIILKPLIDDQNSKRHTGNSSSNFNSTDSSSSILKSLKLNKKSTLKQVSSVLSVFQDGDGGLINTDDADLIELQKLIIIISLIILIIVCFSTLYKHSLKTSTA